MNGTVQKVSAPLFYSTLAIVAIWVIFAISIGAVDASAQAGYSWTVTAKTVSYTVASADFATPTNLGKILTASSSNLTFTLPASGSTPAANSYVRVFNGATGTLTVAPGSGTTLNGPTTFVQNEGAEIWWDGTQYNLQKWFNGTNFPATAISIGGTIQGVATTTDTIYQGGQDNMSSGGSATFRGANVTSGGSTGATAGTVNVLGGDNNQATPTGITNQAGDLNIRPGATSGQLTGMGNQIPGYLQISQTYRLGTPYTVGNLACIYAHNTVQDCSSAALNQTYVGINLASIGASGVGSAVVQIQGIATVNSASAQRWFNGDVVCTDPNTAGVATDNGTVPCSYPSVQVGVDNLTDIAGGATFHKVTLSRGGNLGLGAPGAPTVNTAVNADVICDATNVSPYTCTGIGTTETYFATNVVVPAASTSSHIDGIHHSMSLSTIFDTTGAASSNSATFKLNACTSLSGQTCSGRVTIWQSPAGSLGIASQVSTMLDCQIFTGGTATTLVTGCDYARLTGTAGQSSIVTGVPNSSASWVLVWSITYATAGINNAVALTAMGGAYGF